MPPTSRSDNYIIDHGPDTLRKCLKVYANILFWNYATEENERVMDQEREYAKEDAQASEYYDFYNENDFLEGDMDAYWNID